MILAFGGVVDGFRAPSLHHRHLSLVKARSQDDGGIGSALDAAAAALEGPESSAPQKTDADTIARRSRALWRIGWTCWWSQLILSVISAVVLTFARLVAPSPRARLSLESTFLTGGVLFSALGVISAFASVYWSWRYTRLALRDVSLANIRSALRFGIILNLTGMALTLISAEQVVGGLIAKLLLTPGSLAQISGDIARSATTGVSMQQIPTQSPSPCTRLADHCPRRLRGPSQHQHHVLASFR